MKTSDNDNFVQKAICIIPARAGSKRVPRKNILPLCGRPLLSYTLRAALDSGVFNEVIVTTDDDEIAAVAEHEGARVHMRSEKERAYNLRVLDVCSSALETHEKKGHSYDYLCILLPTSPLRDAEDIRQAFVKLKDMDAKRLMAVTDFEIPPFWALKENEKGFLEPNFGMEYMIRSKDLPKVVVDNGSIYMFKMDVFKKEKSYFGDGLISFKMPREKSIDIDEQMDFKMAEFFMKNKNDK